MAQLFPKWTNKLPLLIAVGSPLLLVLFITGFWYFASPKYTDVGYQPEQPIFYSHKVHAGDLGLDCRYCHTGVEISPIASVPPTQTCMNCHNMLNRDSEKMKGVIESWETGKPIQWIKVHKVPDFAYFDHSAHVNVGVGCESCHGNIAQMEVVFQAKPLSMGWCLDCHRSPETSLRPLADVTNMNWVPAINQKAIGQNLMKERNINPPVNCSGCHR